MYGLCTRYEGALKHKFQKKIALEICIFNKLFIFSFRTYAVDLGFTEREGGSWICPNF